VVEMLISCPDGALVPEATPEVLKASPWLFPHFAKEDGTLIASAQALLVEAPGLRLVVDTCIGNDKPRQFTRRKPAGDAVPATSGGFGLEPRQCRRRGLHPPAGGPCGLEHHVGGRKVGCDLPRGPLPDRQARIRALEQRGRRGAAGDLGRRRAADLRGRPGRTGGDGSPNIARGVPDQVQGTHRVMPA
jgi:hypothetical protein